MPYDYKELRPRIFTEEGQVRFLAVRDRARDLLMAHGQATLEQLINGFGGTNWDQIACVDRMVELGELRLVSKGESTNYDLYRGRWSQPR
jgi:hypothetical protein